MSFRQYLTYHYKRCITKEHISPLDRGTQSISAPRLESSPSAFTLEPDDVIRVEVTGPRRAENPASPSPIPRWGSRTLCTVTLHDGPKNALFFFPLREGASIDGSTKRLGRCEADSPARLRFELEGMDRSHGSGFPRAGSALWPR